MTAIIGDNGDPIGISNSSLTFLNYIILY